MKKIHTVFLLIIVTSCASPNRIIENYLIEEIKNDTIKENVLIKDKVSFNETFRVFQGMKIKTKTNEESAINIQINKMYIDETKESWKKDDFKKIDFVILKSDSIDLFINTRMKNFKNKFYVDKFNLFYISKPYFYKHKKKVFFYITKFQTLKYYKYEEVVIMEKQNGRWVIVDKIPNNDLH
jgi:hypothetical protein